MTNTNITGDDCVARREEGGREVWRTRKTYALQRDGETVAFIVVLIEYSNKVAK